MSVPNVHYLLLEGGTLILVLLGVPLAALHLLLQVKQLLVRHPEKVGQVGIIIVAGGLLVRS